MKKEQFIFLKSKVSDANPNVHKDTLNFLNELHYEDIDFDANIFFIESGGTEEIFRSIYKDYKEPYYLIATEANNSLPASLEIVSFLNLNNLENKLFHGHPKDVRNQLIKAKEDTPSFYRELNLKDKILDNMNLGIIGKPSDWLISSLVDYKEVKDKFGANLIDISFEEFKSEVEKAPYDESSPYFEFKNKIINKDEIKLALKIYHALKVLIAKYNLNALTVRCFDLLSTIHSTSCLALAILNKDGIVATCEGDVPAMLSMCIVKKMFNESSFQSNPSYVDIKNNSAYLAHCTLPLDMCSSFRLDTHFESGIGVGIKGEMFEKRITVFKLSSKLDKFAVFTGKIRSNLNKSNLCRTQINVEFDDPVSLLLSSPCGNHLVIFYGSYKDEILKKLSYK